MARTGANWRVKELQEQLVRAAGGNRPPKGPNRKRDLAFFAGGTATGAAGATVINRRSKPVSKSLVELSEVSKALSNKQLAALQLGTAGAAVAGAEVGGRYIGRKRYEAGKHVNDGFFQGPPVNRGYFKAERKANPGVRYGAKRPEGQETTAVRKASHSQDGTNVRISFVKPAHKTTTLNARSGYMAGRTRGVGRKQESRDANSTPRVEHVRPRRLDGKYASSAKIIEVFKPNGPRQTSMNTLQVHGKVGKSFKQTAGYARIATETNNPATRDRAIRGLGRTAPNGSGQGGHQGLWWANHDRHLASAKKAKVGKGMTQTSGATKNFGDGARVGRRI